MLEVLLQIKKLFKKNSKLRSKPILTTKGSKDGKQKVHVAILSDYFI